MYNKCKDLILHHQWIQLALRVILQRVINNTLYGLQEIFMLI